MEGRDKKVAGNGKVREVNMDSANQSVVYLTSPLHERNFLRYSLISSLVGDDGVQVPLDLREFDLREFAYTRPKKYYN